MKMFKLSLAIAQVAAVSMRSEADARLTQFMSLSSLERNQILTQIKNEEQVDNKWGFLKNIVNIDRFFSSGTEASRTETDAQRRARLAREAAERARIAAEAARVAELQRQEDARQAAKDARDKAKKEKEERERAAAAAEAKRQANIDEIKKLADAKKAAEMEKARLEEERKGQLAEAAANAEIARKLAEKAAKEANAKRKAALEKKQKAAEAAAEMEKAQALEDEKEKKEAEEKARKLAADNAKPKPVGPKPFIRRLIFDFFAYSRIAFPFSTNWINPTIHSTFGFKESASGLKQRSSHAENFSLLGNFYAPPAKIQKMLIQKDGEEGGYITKFYLKYKPQGSSAMVCYNDCKPILTNIKETDEISKVHSFPMDTFLTSGFVQLFAIAEGDKLASGRFDFVMEPTIKIPPKYFPKVVSMFKDRKDQIKSVKVSSFKSALYNEKFDLNSKNGFGGAKKGEALNIDIEFKTPQQVSGFVFRQPVNKKEFKKVQSIQFFTKNREADSFRRTSTPPVNFLSNQSVKFEYRKKIFGAPWCSFVRFVLDPRDTDVLPVGGKFDLLLASVSE